MKTEKRKLLTLFRKNSKQYKILKALLTSKTYLTPRELISEYETNPVKLFLVLEGNKKIYKLEKLRLAFLINNIREVAKVEIDNSQFRGYILRKNKFRV